MARWLRRANEHERVEALLSAYLDGRASQVQRTMVERHLKSCANCERNLATLRATVVAVRDLPHVRAPRSFALPRSMAKQPRSTPRLYPLLRTATAFAAFLFVVVVAGDLYTRFTLFSTFAPMAAPAALPSTSIAMQAAATPAQESAPQIAAPEASRTLERPASAPAPQAAAPLAPVTTASGARQAAATPAPAMTAVTALDAAVPGTEAPRAAAKAVPPETPVEPPTEQAVGNSGLGGGAAGVGQAPGIAAVAPTRLLAEPASEAVTPQPTSTPLAAPTEVARVLAPQPPTAPEQGGAYRIQRSIVNPLRIAEGALAIAVVALGMAAWIARRRNR
jgi:predicted anti-sigma-YlaC factor YlaD